MQLKLNNLNLNTGWYLTEEIVFDSNPPIEFSDISFASYDGAKFISSKYTPKTLTIRGRISQSTVALLEAEMDNFKKTLLSTPNINLNFSYANSFRQYVGNVKNLTLAREKFHVTYCPFEITFIAEDPPFSYDISSIDQVAPNLSEVFSSDAVIGNAYSHTLTMSGTAPPLAKWTYVLDAVSGHVDQVVFKSLTTGKELAINSALSAGDEIVIDQKNLDVMLNAQEREYEGVFPAFNLGGNEFQWQIYGEIAASSGAYLDQSQTLYNVQYSMGTTTNYGQTFTCGSSANLYGIYVEIYKYYYLGASLAPGTLSCYLYNTSAGSPTTLLATSIINNYELSNSTQWVYFPFSQALTSGTQYAFAIQLVNTGTTLFSIHASTSNPYSNGQEVYQRNSVWNIVSSNDLTFKTYMIRSGATAFNHTSSLKIEQEKRFL